MNQRSCTRCVYSSLDKDANGKLSLVCRKRPPLVSAYPIPTRAGIAAQAVTLWPDVRDHDWCGEFEARLDG